MTTKPDFNQIKELHEVYTPETRGIVSNQEIQLITEKLELDQRNIIELRNIRNVAVMYYSRLSDSSREKDIQKTMLLMDAMSAITTVIDGVLIKHGSEI